MLVIICFDRENCSAWPIYHHQGCCVFLGALTFQNIILLKFHASVSIFSHQAYIFAIHDILDGKVSDRSACVLCTASHPSRLWMFCIVVGP